MAGLMKCDVTVTLLRSDLDPAHSGQEFLEVPFFATREGRRGKGYGRCLLEAIEDIARACGAVRILLCSTDDPDTRGTWKRLGFSDSNEDDFKSWDITAADLLHMTNTVQMHKVHQRWW